MRLPEVYYFAVLALAVYRLSYMIAVEDGPIDIFSRWRDWLETKRKPGDHPSWVIRGFQCPLCISFWLGWLAAALYWFDLISWPPLNFCILGLAISGITLVLYANR